MGEFFRGWRRKIGVLTLMMALVLWGGWIRSSGVEDTFRLSIRNTDHFVVSRQGSVQWHSVEYPESPVYESQIERIGWESFSLQPKPEQPLSLILGRGQHGETSPRAFPLYEHPLSLIVGRGQYVEGQLEKSFWPIPYWSVITLLTLASALLLLTKPRKSTPKKTGEPILTVGA